MNNNIKFIKIKKKNAIKKNNKENKYKKGKSEGKEIVNV